MVKLDIIKTVQGMTSITWLYLVFQVIADAKTVARHRWGFKSPMWQVVSMHAITGILAAVIERYRSGLGQYIDISMTDCAVALNNMAAAAGVLAANAVTAAETAHLNGGSFYDYHRTQDGRYLVYRWFGATVFTWIGANSRFTRFSDARHAHLIHKIRLKLSMQLPAKY